MNYRGSRDVGWLNKGTRKSIVMTHDSGHDEESAFIFHFHCHVLLDDDVCEGRDSHWIQQRHWI